MSSEDQVLGNKWPNESIEAVWDNGVTNEQLRHFLKYMIQKTIFIFLSDKAERRGTIFLPIYVFSNRWSLSDMQLGTLGVVVQQTEAYQAW